MQVWDEELNDDGFGTPRRHPRQRNGHVEQYIRTELIPGREIILLDHTLERCMAMGRIQDVFPDSLFYPETELKHDCVVAVDLPKWGIRYVLWTRVIPL